MGNHAPTSHQTGPNLEQTRNHEIISNQRVEALLSESNLSKQLQNAVELGVSADPNAATAAPLKE